MPDLTRLYEERPDDLRGSAQGLLIPNEEEYWWRLRVAGYLIRSRTSAKSVLDVGCGYGDLFEELPEGVRYSGLDTTRWVVEEARRRHPRARIHHCTIHDAGHGWDVVVLLGVLATTDPATWPALARAAKERATVAILVSWLERSRYSGRLIAATEDEIRELFGEPVTIVDVLGEPNRTGLFQVSS